jgi:hypothetical protein
VQDVDALEVERVLVAQTDALYSARHAVEELENVPFLADEGVIDGDSPQTRELRQDLLDEVRVLLDVLDDQRSDFMVVHVLPPSQVCLALDGQLNLFLRPAFRRILLRLLLPMLLLPTLFLSRTLLFWGLRLYLIFLTIDVVALLVL